MRRTALLLVGAVVCAAVAAPPPKPPARKLGPEWVKEKEGDDSLRKLELTALCDTRSRFFYYCLPLEEYQRDLHVHEGMNPHGKTITVMLSGVADPPNRDLTGKPDKRVPEKLAVRIDRTEGKDGQSVEHEVRLGGFRYFDLDGDGGFDVAAHEQGEETRWSIYLEDRRVAVEDMGRRLRLSPPTARARDAETNFTFENGKWRVSK